MTTITIQQSFTNVFYMETNSTNPDLMFKKRFSTNEMAMGFTICENMSKHQQNQNPLNEKVFQPNYLILN